MQPTLEGVEPNEPQPEPPKEESKAFVMHDESGWIKAQMKARSFNLYGDVAYTEASASSLL